MIGRRGLLAAPAFAAGLSRAQAADMPPLKVAVGLHTDWEQIPSELGQRAGLFGKRGVALDILFTQGSAESMQAVIPGAADIGVGLGTGGVLAAYSRGAPLRIIGSASTGSDDVYWYAKGDSAIRTVHDITERTTIGYSTMGSNSHLMLLALLSHHGLHAQPTRAGDLQANFIQVMTGQIDMGVATPPMGLKELGTGEIRMIARGNEIPSMRDQTVRVLAVNATTLHNRPDAIARYVQAYRDTIDFMYSDAGAPALYRELTGTPVDLTRQTMTDFYPRAALDPDRVEGLGKIMEAAIAFKFLAAPLTAAQLQTLVQIPPKLA